MANLKEKIRDRKARIGVIGLGYVGLPLAVEFARCGFDVTGFDVDGSKVDAINASPYKDRFRVFANVQWNGAGAPGWAEKAVADYFTNVVWLTRAVELNRAYS